MKGTDRGALGIGLFFVAVGVAFLLDRLDLWTVDPAFVLPLLLIALGGSILFGARRRRG